MQLKTKIIIFSVLLLAFIAFCFAQLWLGIIPSFIGLMWLVWKE